MTGYIKLFKQIEKWEWYTNTNVKAVFLHCLIKANYKSAKWRGITIEKGSFITSLDKLATELDLSVSQVRTAISKLEMTREIARESHSGFTVITIVNYALYQGCEDDESQPNRTPNDNEIANESQTNRKPIATTNNNNKYNNKENNNKSISRTFQKPTLNEIQNYIIENNYQVDSQRFIDFYESKGWMVGKNKMKDWKAAVRTWQKSSFTKNRIEIVSDYSIKEINISDNEADEIKRSLKSLGGN